MADSRRSRSESSKRKSPHDFDSAPRKKQNRATRDTEDDSDNEAKSQTHKSKAQSAPRVDKDFTSVNDLKKRIRDVKRLLNKGTLPADARIVQERALAGYEQDLEDETTRRDRSQLIKKYHFVRFLDRKTASKNMNKLRRREKDQNLDSDQKAALQQKIHEAQINLNYTIYYPLTEKYLSLYPKSQEKASAEAGESESDSAKKQKQPDLGARPPLWAVVEKCTADGTLDLLREGKLNIGYDGQPTAQKPKPAKESKKSKKESKKESEDAAQFGNRRERRAAKDIPIKADKQTRKAYGRDQRERLQDVAVAPARGGDGDDSDGGFFEE